MEEKEGSFVKRDAPQTRIGEGYTHLFNEQAQLPLSDRSPLSSFIYACFFRLCLV
jgi:hypothetical protein